MYQGAGHLGRLLPVAGTLALAVAIAGWPALAQDRESPVATAPQAMVLDYLVINQPITDVFAMVERDTGLRIMVTGAVRGRIEHHRLSGPAEPALGALAGQHDLDLFVYNGTMHVSARAEAALRLIRLDGNPPDRALAALRQAGLVFDPETLSVASDGNSLNLSGPPRMLAIAEAIIESLPPIGAIPPQIASVRVRRAGQLQIETIGAPQRSAPSPAATGTETEQGNDS